VTDSTLVLAFVIVGVLLVGWIGVRSGRAASHTMTGWMVNDRKMGPVLTWFLLGTEIYTAFTFLGLSGFAYAHGGGVFYNVATNDIAYALGFFMLPAIGLLGRKFGFVTQSDFAAGRYRSRAVGVTIALCTAVIMIAYIDLNIEGLGAVLGVLTNHGLSQVWAETLACIVLAAAVLLGGIRGNAWQSAIKDVLMFGSLGVLFFLVPQHFFGGLGPMFHQLATKIPSRIIISKTNPAYGPSWYWSTAFLNGIGQWMWPQFFNVAFSARGSRTLKLQAVFMPLYQMVKIAVITMGFAAILIFAGHKIDSNEVMLLLAKAALPSWALGLFALAACLSAIVPAGPIIMMSSTLLARNVYAALRPGTDDQTVFRLTRGLVFVVTAAALLLAVFAHTLIASVLLIAYDFIAQLVPAIMIGGLFWRRASAAGVLAGLAVGWGGVAFLLFTGNDPVFGLNAGFAALVLNTVTFVIVSLCTQPVARPELDDYFSTFRENTPRETA
jgi:solute:Na+ symporter, SSS family